MGYYLKFIRESGESISETEWREAISLTSGLRVREPSVVTGRNPATGAAISIKSPTVSAELRLRAPGLRGLLGAAWVPVFHRYPDGHITVKAVFDAEDPSDPVRRAAAQLARILKAEIRGEAGEKYDFG